MGQPVRPTYEPGPEVATRLRWVRGRLLGWFARDGRSIPWRGPGRTPYEVMVAEVLLQRTTAPAVAHAYAGFLARYPSWDSLAHAPLVGLETALRPLGLWRQKALAFQQLARSIEAHGGVLPRTRQELERLPGIGPYTASAVLALVYGRAEPLLDANMDRLLGRFLGPSECAGASHRRTMYALALRLVRGRLCLAVNWAALDFGALVCRHTSPRCPPCPLRTRCVHARSLRPRATSISDVL
jgi:A/G-specific adenine glycosylase